jgi:hypothetical protein
LLLAIFAAALFVGCESKQPTPKSREIPRESALMEIDRCYSNYVNGTVDIARTNLLAAANYLEKSSCFEEADRATMLWLEYSRLTVLENKVGNPDLAEVYLMKAKFWDLRNSELLGKSPKVMIDSMKLFDLMKCKELVEKIDKGLHSGELANYNRVKAGVTP